MRSAELIAVGAHDIGDFQGWPHGKGGLGFRIDGERQQIQRAGGGADCGRGQTKITSRRR